MELGNQVGTHGLLAGAVALVAAALATTPSAWGGVVGGVPENRRGSQLRAEGGALLDVSGTVNETFRAYYAATGRDQDQAKRESYDLDDFGIDRPYASFGLQYGHQGEVFGVRLELLYMGISADATAKRDYYVGLMDDVKYRGVNYEHMKIPKGCDFSTDFTGGMGDVMLTFSPFTLEGDAVQFTPGVELGLVGIAGNYELDAGPATGTAVYQNPPVHFVVGGKSSSTVGIAAPMIGANATLTLGRLEGTRWETRGNFDVFAYDGSSKPFSSAREKDLDITFMSAGLESSLLFPLSDGTELEIGAAVRMMNLDGSIKAKEKKKEKIIQAHERFDKDIDFDLMTGLLFIGFRF